MRQLFLLNDLADQINHWINSIGKRLAVFMIIPLSGMSYWIAGLWGFALAAVLLPLALVFLPRQSGLVLPKNGDALTGLPTPAQFDRLIAPWSRDLANPDKKIGCILIHVQRFNDFTAQFGETCAMQMQRALAKRLTNVLRHDDVATRLDSGCFKVMLHPVRHLDLEVCIHLSNRIKAALEVPVDLDGHSHRPQVDIGFSISSQIAVTQLSDLEDAAMIALSAARKNSQASIRSFSPALLEQHKSRKKLIDEAKDALTNQQVVAWFQPQVSTETGAVTGFEALARWQHPQHGIMPPGDFLDTLAECGQLERLSQEMLAQAIKALNNWELGGYSIPRVGINFSGDELHNPMLAERMGRELDRYDIAPGRIAIEVLETVIASSPDGVVARNLRDLRKLGCHVDLDDFGTGHAAISAIQRFSANRLKIDRSFVKGVDRDSEQQKLIAAIVTMAEQLGLDTLGEGVETAGEHAMLAQLGVNHVQGFGIARPMRFEDTLPWMRKHQSKLPELPRIGRK